LVLIEERKALLDEYEKLTKTVFAHRKLGVLHGRLKQQEKDDVLMAFKNHELDILVSTSVVEVGVDVANATVMIIESAEFFGLAQLHQLRGRVGRGAEQSYCFLFASNWTQNTKRRLDMLVQYHDGFTLAEKDLELRGPGEIYGTMQAGFAPFKFASLGNLTLVEKAKRISERLNEIGEDKWPIELKDWISERRENTHIE
jgi:ATP-dependent DNA helicase RecG